jgi:hypothetical protein
VNGQLHASNALPEGKESLVAIEHVVVWVPEPIFRFEKQKNFFLLPGFIKDIPRRIEVKNVNPLA